MGKYKYISITVGKNDSYLSIQNPKQYDEETLMEVETEGITPVQSSVFTMRASLKELLGGLENIEENTDVVVELLRFCSERDEALIDNYYNTLVSAFVRSKYSEDEMEAIICNVLDADSQSEEHNKEYLEMQAYRKECKKMAKEVIEKAYSKDEG